MLIKYQFLSLVIIKTLVLVSSSILTPNTGSLLALMILHLKPKVINVLAKTWFTKTNFQQKMLNYSPIFSLCKYFCKRIRPVNEWHVIVLACAHTCQCLFRCAIVARVKNYMIS